MDNVHELIKNWRVEVVAGVEWSVSPGVPWCAVGLLVRIAASASIGAVDSIGAWARIGAAASIGDRASIGAAAKIGERARIGDRASIGAGASIGERARIGAAASIGDRASIGAAARIGEGATFLADLGSFEGYRKVICSLDGVAYIGAGCRWFTLADAKKHWHAKKADRRITHAMLSVATVIAKQHKLREGIAKGVRRGK